MKKIVIAGGTGFIGKYSEAQFKLAGYVVLIISRKKEYVQWSDTAAMVKALNNADMLINFAGKSVNCRYNKANKKEIMYSRTLTTKKLGDALLLCNAPPPLWINSGTVTIYRHAEDRSMTEENGEIGKGFSVDVAKAWEKSFFDFRLPATRQIVLRISIVLGKGGALKPLANLVKCGLGGKQGKGTQMFSWLHIEDLFNIILFLQRHSECSGVFNCSSPKPVSNKVMMETLRTVLKRPFGLPAPEWLLKAGAALIKTETELILKSRWVIPERLEKEGYHFKFPDLSNALTDILRRKP